MDSFLPPSITPPVKAPVDARYRLHSNISINEPLLGGTALSLVGVTLFFGSSTLSPGMPMLSISSLFGGLKIVPASLVQPQHYLKHEYLQVFFSFGLLSGPILA